VTRLAVLGSPIGHSLSPAIHAAAYRELGLDWEYGRADVPEGGLGVFVAGLDEQWRGLSLTMPLKREAIVLADRLDPVAKTTAQANTLVLGADGIGAWNTDVAGVAAALRSAGVEGAGRAVVLGGGATAESAVEALRALGAEVAVAVRTPERAARLDGRARIVPLAEAPLAGTDVVVSTLPPRAEFAVAVPQETQGVLLDVAYDPWPTPLAAAWADAGGAVVHGVEMLLHQALVQVRLFTGRAAGERLPDEERVFLAMRAAVEGS
jgi:shikimate dehydrogenase